MNLNQIVNMIMRIILRKAVNKGINAGIKRTGKKGRGNRQRQNRPPQD